jgi:hypothetical protein
VTKSQESEAVKLSDFIDIDDKHREAYLCSKGSVLGNQKLPINFRTIDNGIVQFSASGIFTKSQIINAFSSTLKVKKIYVVDLVKEYHGFIDYVQDAIPFTWRSLYNEVNFGVTYPDIELCEEEVIEKIREKLRNEPIEIISRFSSNEGAVEEVYQKIKINKYESIVTESELLKEEKINYLRLPCTDHSPPPYEAILDLAYFTQNTFDPQTDWVHFHCHGGKGRSTTFSLIFDMFMRFESGNLSQTSFETLIDFHRENGGKDLAMTPIEIWKQDLAEERYNLLGKLYYLLLKIEENGLKDIYSVALKIAFLNQNQQLDHMTFSRIVLDSGPVVQEIIAFDKNIENNLYNLYLNPDILNVEFNSDSSNVLDDCHGSDNSDDSPIYLELEQSIDF